MARYAARLFILILVVSMVVGSQLSMTQQVHAHGLAAHGLAPQVGCRGADCTGDDPILDGCNLSQQTLTDENVKDSSGTIIGDVQLKYSGPCNARWTYVLAWDGGARVSASIYGTTGANYSAIGIGSTHTLMVGAQQAYSCGTVSGWRACTVQK